MTSYEERCDEWWIMFKRGIREKAEKSDYAALFYSIQAKWHSAFPHEWEKKWISGKDFSWMEKKSIKWADYTETESSKLV